MKDYFKDYELVRSYFEDDFSKLLFDYKINNLVKRTGDSLNELLYEKYPVSKLAGFDAYYKRRGKRDIFLFGTKAGAMRDLKALTHAGYEVKAFISEDEFSCKGGYKENLPILTLGELVVSHIEAIVVVSDEKNADTYWKELVSVGFPMENIYLSHGKLRSEFGNIYFDLPQLTENADREGEVFIDAGAFDGETSLRFLAWCQENKLNAEKIYLFEPMPDGIMISKSKLKDYPVEYHMCGLGSEETTMSFCRSAENLMGSRISKQGEIEIPIHTIDQVLDGRKATFIKMDIEGAEAEALKGAAETIRRYRPKLAISMYHKWEDILELPMLVKELRPDYKLYLRHYSNYRWDFVMYAL